MQKNKKPVKEVVKPVLYGSWHGKDAWKLGAKTALNILFVSLIYLLLSLLLTFDSLFLRIATALVLVAAATSYLYTIGMTAGQADAAYGEILYTRRQEGKAIPPQDLERSFHPAKGFFAVLTGAAPFVLVALVFACMTSVNTYTLGVLPNWLTHYTRQSGIGDALAYYQNREGVQLMTVLRVVVRCFTLPFMNVAVKMGDAATLWAERLSPLWVLVAPLGYGFGYKQGIRIRTKINTGIAIGDRRKKRRANKERRARTQKRAPERLI